MTGTNEQRARELLAAEYERTGNWPVANGIRSAGNLAYDYATAVAAVTAALAEPKAGAVHAVLQIGNRGALYDRPDTRRAFTYAEQPGNIDASKLGSAMHAASQMSAGDCIDQGLALLKALQDEGFGVFQIDPQAMLAAPQAKPGDGEARESIGRRSAAVQMLVELGYVWNGDEWACTRLQPTEQQGQAVAWLIDWPDEPDLGHYFADSPVESARSRPLVFGDLPQPAAVDAVRALADQFRVDASECEGLGLKESMAAFVACADRLEAALSAQGREGEVGRD